MWLWVGPGVEIRDAGMSNGTIALIVLGCLMTYIMVAGVVQKAGGFYKDEPFGLLWPVLLPWLVGTGLAALGARMFAFVTDWLHAPRIPKARVVR